MKARAPEVLFFDAAGTLIELNRSVGHHYSDVASMYGFPATPAAFDDAFRRAWRQMPRRPPVEGPRADDDRRWWRELVSKTFHQLGYTAGGDTFDRCFAAMYDYFAEPGVWQLFPEVTEVLMRVSKEFRLAVISNFDGRLHRILADLGVSEHFEQIIVSSEVGADKPHREIYDAALRVMHVRPEEALHIGDHPVLDWDGAAALGIPVFKLDRPNNSLADLPV